MKPYPIMLDLSRRKAVVVGGGRVAARKVRDLLACDAMVRVIAPTIDQAIEEMGKVYPDSLEVLQREYRKGDLAGAALAFAATGVASVNRDVYEEANMMGIPVNAVDDPSHCTFYVPSWANRDGLVLAVSTGGVSPALAARIRRELETHLPPSLGEALSSLAEARRLLLADSAFSGLSSHQRGAMLKQIAQTEELTGKLIEHSRSGTIRDFLLSLRGHIPTMADGDRDS